MQASVTEWLDKTSEKYPEKTAIIDKEKGICYEEYRRKSLMVARALIDTKIGERKPVAVYLKKGAEMLISFLGVAYSKNFYSPIDVEMPTSRVNKILEVLKPGVIITTKELKTQFKEFEYEGGYLLYDNLKPLDDDEAIVNEVSQSIIDTDLLYVLFTSGSTGVPKGVAIRHRSVIDYIEWVTEEFDVTEGDSFGNQAPFYFDNSILDIYSTLKTGAEINIIPKDLFSQPILLLEYIQKWGINSIFWVPSALITVAKLRALKNIDLSSTLKRVLFCGEVMPNKQLNFWRKYLPHVLYANLYGPTEITDACTFYKINRVFCDEESLPIGKPMKNTDVLVLDEKNHLISPCEKGKVGELCVRGTCLAAGYYNNPEKTREVFVQNPLNDCYEEKIYRTGDLVSYNEYGELIYIGRKDHQIKHLGHRIELGEIETAAFSLDDISRCCCVFDDKQQSIVMFIEAQGEYSRNEINERLEKLIPKYMLPNKVKTISALPLNANGKIDRKALMELL